GGPPATPGGPPTPGGGPRRPPGGRQPGGGIGGAPYWVLSTKKVSTPRAVSFACSRGRPEPSKRPSPPQGSGSRLIPYGLIGLLGSGASGSVSAALWKMATAIASATRRLSAIFSRSASSSYGGTMSISAATNAQATGIWPSDFASRRVSRL